MATTALGVTLVREPEAQFILLPSKGLRVHHANKVELKYLLSLQHASAQNRVTFKPPEANGVTMTVIDSVHEDGPKLVEMTNSAALALNLSELQLRAVPVRHYHLVRQSAFSPSSGPTVGTGIFQVRVIRETDNSPIEGVMVTAFTDYAHNIGAQSATDSTGVASISVPMKGSIERLYVEPVAGVWGAFQRNVPYQRQITIQLAELKSGIVDALRYYYPPGKVTDGQGVRVAIVDTGVDNHHPDLVHVTTGRNTVAGENSADWADNGLGHGTHVAGIIGARAAQTGGMEGLAPAANLLSFRVFGSASSRTTNYQVMKAMVYAMDHSVNIINLSLGKLDEDDVVRDAVADASNQGILVVAAVGNDQRGPITAPAKFPPAIAVSAFGRKKTYPSGSIESSYEDASPSGTDPEEYMASFTNFGQGVYFVAPGVGIVSCASGGGYLPWSGSSMACAVVTGLAARKIGPVLKNMSSAGIKKTQDLINLLVGGSVNLGFPPNYQGFGRLTPN